MLQTDGLLLTPHQFVAAFRGDLSNITAPPFLLSTTSFVEFPMYLAERPALLMTSSKKPDPAFHALSVLNGFSAP